MTLGWLQDDFRMTLGLCQVDFRMMSGWLQDDVRLTSGWCQVDFRMMSGWLQDDIGLTSGWHWVDFRIIVKWLGLGLGTFRRVSQSGQVEIKIGYLYSYTLYPNTYNLVYGAWQCSTIGLVLPQFKPVHIINSTSSLYWRFHKGTGTER